MHSEEDVRMMYLCPTTVLTDSVPPSKSCRVECSSVDRIRSAESNTLSFVVSRWCGNGVTPGGVPLLVRGRNGVGAGEGDRRGGSGGLFLTKEGPATEPE
jgi:hypothetical protein